jgi:hypothetical protein
MQMRFRRGIVAAVLLSIFIVSGCGAGAPQPTSSGAEGGETSRASSAAGAKPASATSGAQASTATASPPAPQSRYPNGYWPEARVREILDKTQTIRLAPDLSELSSGEAQAVKKLLEVGAIFQTIYETSRHAEARSSLRELEAAHKAQGSPAATRDLLLLYRLFQGPIAVTLDNKREPFLPVAAITPGKNVYPAGTNKQPIESFLNAHPDELASILHVRSVVRRAEPAAIAADLDALRRHPVLDTLHPGLRARLTALAQAPDAKGFYAVPYAIAYADEMVSAYGLVMDAASAIERDDGEFAGYLRNRARDLLSNEYESGDASWVTGRFKRLNAQIGAYETYDDELFGTKAFYSLSLLLRDQKASADLEKAILGLQELENALPHGPHKRVKESISIGVYNIIADFGQARGGNTASILPNEAYLARRYGRTILLRSNILQNPDLFANSKRIWAAAVAGAHQGDLKQEGDFHRVLWHEVGHYLGVDADKAGRDLDAALQENSGTFEEMKADLVSLYLVPTLRKRGYYDEALQRAVYAGGVLRVLQSTRPRRDQTYRAMMLMQMNYFLEKGLLEFDRKEKRLRIHYERYHNVIGSLLKEILALQYAGDKAASDRFLDKYMTWDENLHEVVASQVRGANQHRYLLVRYGALGE